MPTRRRMLQIGLAIGLGPAETAAQTERKKLPRIGVIMTGDSNSPAATNFYDELARLGHVMPQTIEFEARYSGGRNELLPAFAAEVITKQVDVVAALGAVTVRAVRQVSQAIPVVFMIVLDPVADGLVTSFERREANITGVTSFDPDQARAQILLLKEIIPGLTTVAIIGDAGVSDLLSRANEQAATAQGLTAQVIALKGADDDIETLFMGVKDRGVGAVIATEVPAVFRHRQQILASAERRQLPLMVAGDWTFFGAPIAYGTSIVDGVRRMARMVDRILKGEKPGDLNIERTTRHWLTINMPAARASGLAIPSSVLARADKVIN